MKKITLALVVLALVSIACIAVADCEHSWEWQWDNNGHWQECVLCGEKTTSESHQSEWKMDADNHWYKCAICGAETNQVRHEGYRCDQGESHCYYCGIKESEGAVIQMYTHLVDDDKPISVEETTHTYTCKVCGESVTTYHYSSCPDVDVCRICNATKDDGIVFQTIYHSWDGYVYSETEHWNHCTRCGEDLNIDVHWAYCDAPDVCADCGKSVADGIIIDEVYHDWDDYSYNETEHWNHCTRCGNNYNLNAHWAVCTDLETCEECGKKLSDGITIEEIYHLGWSDTPIHNDEKQHWYICKDCGEKVQIGDHEFDSTNTCKECGYKASSQDPSETPTEAPTVDPAVPQYSATADFDADNMVLSGTVAHKEGTEEAPELFARITYFMADGSYTVVPAPIDENSSFESMISGSVVHIAVQVTNAAKIVPGTYTRYGGYEFDVE